jgi:malonyl-CoA O-methyltransferase
MTDTLFATEYLPASVETGQDLVLLHGWASNREIWRPMLACLRGWANVTLVDLPGCSASRADFLIADLASLEAEILAVAPERAVYMGWSLGGQLASRLAAGHPSRVSALVTICANPSFLSRPEWPGMDQGVFKAFRESFAEDPAAAIGRVDSLQTSGSGEPRALARTLSRVRRDIDQNQLLAGLDLLETLDLRTVLPMLSQPQLHFFGRHDGLVSPAVSAALAALLADAPAGQTAILENASHVAPLEAATEIASVSYGFLSQARLLRGTPTLPEKSRPVVAVQARTPEGGTSASKTDVADSFSRAASHYDSAAQLQREVGTRLLDSLGDTDCELERVVDLGSGTGYFYPFLQNRFPGAEFGGVDLAPGMVKFAWAEFPAAGQWLVGDAENLPLASQSVDLIFSSLAIQWCPSLPRLFAELARVLKPGGRCVFTSLGPDTLRELRTSWAAVDGHQHVNSFLPALALEQVASTTPGLTLSLRSEQYRMEYDRVRDLLTELKTLGAHNMNRGRQSGLTGRRALQGMLAAYESWRDQGKLPATYDVFFGVVEAA